MLKTLLKRYFLTGLLVITPIWGTILILKALFVTVDGILGETVARWVPEYYVPGVGILALILLIFSVGLFAANIIGRQIMRIWEDWLNRLPLVRGIYSTLKSMMDILSFSDRGGKVEVLVPLGGIAEVALLIRNLDPEDRQPHRYSWSATAEPGFPFELGTIEAQPAGSGILIRWETLSERRTLGYNVYRSRGSDGAAIRVNPVWVPAIGGTGSAAAHQYLDTDVEGGVLYTYRIEAVTEEGLGASSESVTAAAH